MKWFKHDASANRDAKLQRLRMKYGLEGYGLYWYCVELIAEGIEESNLTFELEHDAEIIAFNTAMHFEKVQEMMAYMVKLKLFEESDGTITCFKLAKRLDQSSTSNPQMRKLISEIKKNPDFINQLSGCSHDLANSEPQDCHDGVKDESAQNHDSIKKPSAQIRLDKNRLDKKDNSRFTPPSLEEVTLYCKERENDVDPNSFVDHYQTNGWKRGNTKIKDWKACVRTWERKDAKQPNHPNQTPPNAPRRAMPKAGTVQ